MLQLFSSKKLLSNALQPFCQVSLLPLLPLFNHLGVNHRYIRADSPLNTPLLSLRIANLNDNQSKNAPVAGDVGRQMETVEGGLVQCLETDRVGAVHQLHLLHLLLVAKLHLWEAGGLKWVALKAILGEVVAVRAHLRLHCRPFSHLGQSFFVNQASWIFWTDGFEVMAHLF